LTVLLFDLPRYYPAGGAARHFQPSI